jgi:hypothetical protein
MAMGEPNVTGQSQNGTSTARLLILTLTYPHRASYYDDWRDAFVSSRSFDSRTLNILDVTPATLARALDATDAIVMLHACNSDTLDYLRPIAPVLRDRRRAKLLTFVGNEYNSPYLSTVERSRLFREARCDIVATQLLEEAGTFLYGETGARIISVPHALNPEAFPAGPPHDRRRLDLGVKGYRYPAFLGDDERNRMIAYFQEHAARYGLTVDISEDRRLDRSGWAAFLGDCRGTISTETGSWYLERNDALIGRIHAYLKTKRSGVVISNESPLRRLGRRLPMPIKSVLWSILKRGPIRFEILDDLNTPFAELDELFFRSATRAPVYGKAISSRHFDAIGTRTCQIMLEGRFNDILTANEHYIAVAPDFANIDDAVTQFKDSSLREQIAATAYEHVMSGHTYAHRVEQVRRAFDAL